MSLDQRIMGAALMAASAAEQTQEVIGQALGMLAAARRLEDRAREYGDSRRSQVIRGQAEHLRRQVEGVLRPTQATSGARHVTCVADEVEQRCFDRVMHDMQSGYSPEPLPFGGYDG